MRKNSTVLSYLVDFSRQNKSWFLEGHNVNFVSIIETEVLNYEPCVGLHPSALTYVITPWCRVLEKLTGSKIVKKFPAFYGTQRFITTYTNACHLSLSWARSFQSMPPPSHFLKIHINIILLSMPGSSKWSLFLRFPDQNPVYTFPLCHMC